MTEVRGAVSHLCRWRRLWWSDIDQWSLDSIPSPSKTCRSPPESRSLVVPAGIQIAPSRTPVVLPPTTPVGLPLQESLLAPLRHVEMPCSRLLSVASRLPDRGLTVARRLDCKHPTSQPQLPERLASPSAQTD